MLAKHFGNYLLHPFFLVYIYSLITYVYIYYTNIDCTMNCRIVGIAGISESLFVVTLCGLCTLLTAISLSAIATNGAMKVFSLPFTLSLHDHPLILIR